MYSNRIAVYGHRWRFSGRIVAALIESGAPITVLHRPSQDTSGLPASVQKIEVDVLNADALVEALREIDIVLSPVGDEGVGREHGFVKAIPRTDVKLFVPSDLSLRYGEEGLKVPIIKKKEELQEAVRQAGIPMTVVLFANFAEFTIKCIAMGVDIRGNRLVYAGNAAEEKAAM
ncbi:Eugenol synthase 1, partial [Colletotrichum shisoi]